MTCESCKKNKEKLNVVRSLVVPSLDLKLCPSCKFDKLEPRGVIILAARSGKNMEQVKTLVKERRYIGSEIKLSEILA